MYWNKKGICKTKKTFAEGQKAQKGILDIIVIILSAAGNRSSNRLLFMSPGVKPKVCASNGEGSLDDTLTIKEKSWREILMISKIFCLRGYIDVLGQLRFSEGGAQAGPGSQDIL